MRALVLIASLLASDGAIAADLIADAKFCSACVSCHHQQTQAGSADECGALLRRAKDWGDRISAKMRTGHRDPGEVEETGALLKQLGLPPDFPGVAPSAPAPEAPPPPR